MESDTPDTMQMDSAETEPSTLFDSDVAEVEVESSEPAAEENRAKGEFNEEDEEDDEDLDDDMLEELLNADSDEEGDVEDVQEDAMAVEGDGNASNKQSEKSGLTTDKIVRLPLSRIKQIIKLDEDVDRVNGEAAFLVAKAAELFIQSFAKEVYKVTARSKKKTVQLRDINTCIDEVMCMQFLEGCFLEQL
ncbi:DNA polymerase epsilon subunit 4-like [Neocloeon triangulifer]|uniref:DNA polymerase epsilon subunit 4-like n=1 Tax=Neocloeon triangulifer TaxID=2078957 RepID=UPI00286F8D2F|nr:DNA polymerase epsilon subunit 4-like [Neocloeon triangulifer]XP_059473782.1 DNA polymerase epsilon subunit 4-like [Neocloeon triangulifer]